MEENFKKQMQKLAMLKKQEQENEIDPIEKKQKEEGIIQTFNRLKVGAILPMVDEVNEIFKETGNSFLFFSNQEATALNDQIRTFCQIFYYPQTRGKEKVGLNTASILFECFPSKAEIQISSNTELRPTPLKLIRTLNISDFNENSIEADLSTFVSAVTKN